MRMHPGCSTQSQLHLQLCRKLPLQKCDPRSCLYPAGNGCLVCENPYLPHFEHNKLSVSFSYRRYRLEVIQRSYSAIAWHNKRAWSRFTASWQPACHTGAAARSSRRIPDVLLDLGWPTPPGHLQRGNNWILNSKNWPSWTSKPSYHLWSQ